MMELKLLQEQLNGYINEQIERRVRALRQKKFEGVNKLEWFLAWQLKKRREKNIIIKIKEKGREISDQKGI